jgi:hypothetical protein
MYFNDVWDFAAFFEETSRTSRVSCEISLKSWKGCEYPMEYLYVALCFYSRPNIFYSLPFHLPRGARRLYLETSCVGEC